MDVNCHIFQTVAFLRSIKKSHSIIIRFDGTIPLTNKQIFTHFNIPIIPSVLIFAFAFRGDSINFPLFTSFPHVQVPFFTQPLVVRPSERRPKTPLSNLSNGHRLSYPAAPLGVFPKEAQTSLLTPG